MKFDSRWNSRARPIFRILALLLSLVFIFYSVITFIDIINSNSIKFDSSFKSGISSLITGIILLIIGLRGRLFKMNGK